MARFQVVHSQDAATIIIRGDKRNPEPTSAIIQFPGGCVEVSRCTEGSYWAHVSRTEADGDEPGGRVIASRLDYVRGAGEGIPPLPAAEHIAHMGIRVAID